MLDGQPVARFAARLQLAAPREIATADGEPLSFGPGEVELDIELGFAQRNEEEEVDVLGCRLRLRDAGGGWWQGDGAFAPSFLSPFAAGPQPRARFEDAAPASWAAALRERPLLRGIHDLWDDRHHVMLDLGERRVEVALKYQGPVLDLALLEDFEEGDRLVVRVERLHDAESDPIEPFVFTLPLARLLEIDTRLDEERWLDDGELVLRPLVR